MIEAAREFLNMLRESWETIMLLLTWGGITVVYLRRRVHWARKQFLSQVNFSLNYIHNGQLAMRTLLETTASQVWLNDYGVKLVSTAATRTTVDHPFIELDEAADRDFINRAVLNVLSERFAETYVAAALGLPAHTANFIFAITCEKYQEIRTHKLRVLIIEEQALLEWFTPEKAVEIRIGSIVYQARLKTLQAMRARFLRDQETGKAVLGHLEMGVVSR
jgi:hypothetical protein